ncbi:MAG: methyltransferase domain-containing protein [Candidatus Eisenbacteria bacterium]
MSDGFTPDAPPLILDARDAAAFARGHAPGAAHLWAGAWDAHAAALPPREDAFVVVAEDEATAQALVDRLVAGGHRAARVAPPTLCAERSESGPSRRDAWRPSAWLLACAAGLVPGARVLDVACGSGRNLVALARRGARAVGVDLLPDALERARRLAGATAVDLVVADATAPLPFRDSAFDVVMGFRYLDRALFPRLPSLLVAGGELWWETFGEEQARFGHPRRPEHLLAAGELGRLCRESGLEVMAVHESVAPGGRGPALSAVRARRAADPVLAAGSERA